MQSLTVDYSVIEFENLMAQNEIMGSCDIKLVHPGWITG